jgi:hypothetical protein
MDIIAIARQIFQNKVFFFFTSWGSFPCKKEKKSFYEKFAGRQQYHNFVSCMLNIANKSWSKMQMLNLS